MKADSNLILLVDDIEDNLYALDFVLEDMGFVTKSARSGREALELLLVHDFALALLDVNMPEMDGFQLAELMRGTARTRSIPIIFITAAVFDSRAVFQGYDSGAVDFLIKPVDPRILRSKIETFITLHEQKRQLGESLRLQETFVAALNHDLRTPLQAISIGLEALGDTELTAEQQEVTRRLASATHRMSIMLDELHDVARTRLGEGIALERKRSELCKVVQDVVREAELRVSDKELVLQARGDTMGDWDVARMSRLTANLVTNALVHGAGTVDVRVDGTQTSEVTLEVHNPGVIPPDQIPTLFEPFKRGQTGEGLGLGLYIVREIAGAHGGAVTVTSTAIGGTQFTVRLPRHAPPS